MSKCKFNLPQAIRPAIGFHAHQAAITHFQPDELQFYTCGLIRTNGTKCLKVALKLRYIKVMKLFGVVMNSSLLLLTYLVAAFFPFIIKSFGNHMMKFP